MIEETPAKVCACLGISMFSLFFLFAVSATNASFSGTEAPLPDIFGPDRVVAAVDAATNAYSQFVDANLIQPAKFAYLELADGYNYVSEQVADGYGQEILAYTGLQALEPADDKVAQAAAPQVAGAYTEAEELEYKSFGGFNIDTLYSLLLK